MGRPALLQFVRSEGQSRCRSEALSVCASGCPDVLLRPPGAPR